MDSDSEDEDWKERSDGFLRKLYAFHERNGTPIRRLPTLGGRELNLYHLYLKVRELNGAEEVTKNRQWGEVVRSFNLPRSVTSASYAIRQHYMKLLGKFEAYEDDPKFANYFHSSTPPSSSHSPSPFPPSSSSRATPPPPPTTSSTHPLSHSLTASHPSQSSSADSSKSVSTVPIPTYRKPPAVVAGDGGVKKGGRECDKVIRSLVSGFPNEVDFALNALTVMSFEKPESVPVTKVPYLLDVLLSHVAVFPEEDYNLEILFLECWSRASEMDFFEFWDSTVPEWVYSSVFPQHPAHAESCIPGECTLTAYRVTQVANILRNLSFKASHAQFLSQHEALLRFLYLSCNCSMPAICGLALDTLANLAPFILLPIDGVSFSITSLIFASVHQWILSSDKLTVLRGVEILGELTWCAHNEAIISGTPHEIYRRLYELLLLPDCFLLLTTLNTIYNLSLLGHEITTNLLTVDSSLSILLSLLTLRVESFGDKALKQVKLIDTRPSTDKNVASVSSATKKVSTTVKSGGGGGGVQFQILTAGGGLVQVASAPAGVAKQAGSIKPSSSASANKPSQSLKIGNMVIPTKNLGKKQPEQGGTTLSPLLHSTVNSTNPTIKAVIAPSLGPLTLEQLQSLLVKNVPIVSPQASAQKSAGTTSSAVSTATNAQGAVLKQLSAATATGSKQTRPVVVNQNGGLKNGGVSSKQPSAAKTGNNSPAESFAALWLRSNFEESRGSYVTQMEVYSQYIKACSDAGQTQMLNLTDFTKAVKAVFSHSLSTRITFANQIVYMIAGIARKQISSIAATNLIASASKSRTPSPSLSLPPSTTAPSTGNSTSQPLLKSKEHSPTPQNDQIAAAAESNSKNRVSPSPSIYSTASSSNHVPAASSPLLKSHDRSSVSPSPSLQNPLLSAVTAKSLSPAPSPSLSSASHNHVSASSNRISQLTKSRESSISPSPLSRVSISPTPPPPPSMHGAAATSQSASLSHSQSRVLVSPAPSSACGTTAQSVLVNSRAQSRDSFSPTPPPFVHGTATQSVLNSQALNRDSTSPTPPSSVMHSVATLQSNLVKSSNNRGSFSPTPPPTGVQKSSQNSSEHRKRSISPASSVLSSASNSDHPKSTIKSNKSRSLDSSSPCSPFTAVSLSTLASQSSSSLSSHGTSVSVESEQNLSEDVAAGPPDSKRIKLGGGSTGANGHDGVRSELLKSNSVSRTPSPQIFSKDNVSVNGKDYVKPATSTIARTPTTSFATGLTTDTHTAQPAARHSIATESVGKISLATGTQSAFTPTSTRSTTFTENTGHIGQTDLTINAQSAFTPPRTSGSGATLGTSVSVSSNGTRMAAVLDSTNNGGFTHSGGNGESIEVDDALELLTGPVCQWANCARRFRSDYSLFSHLVYDHLPLLPSYPHQCFWQGCSSSSIKRMRPSLMTHLQTHHCCLEPKPAPLNVARTLQQLRAISPFQYNEEENPLTKAVRLTAALVLRNLARTSSEARMSLQCHESELCQVALSDSEASTAAAQCLHFIHNPPTS